MSTNNIGGGSRKMNEEENWKMRRSMESKVGRHRSGMKPTIHPCIAQALSGRHILIIGSTGSGI